MKCYRILDSTFNGTQLDSGIPLQAYSTSTELQNPRKGIPPDSGTPDPGFHRTLEAEFHLSGIPPDSKTPDLVFHRTPEFRVGGTQNSTWNPTWTWDSAGIPPNSKILVEVEQLEINKLYVKPQDNSHWFQSIESHAQ